MPTQAELDAAFDELYPDDPLTPAQDSPRLVPNPRTPREFTANLKILMGSFLGKAVLWVVAALVAAAVLATLFWLIFEPARNQMVELGIHGFAFEPNLYLIYLSSLVIGVVLVGMLALVWRRRNAAKETQAAEAWEKERLTSEAEVAELKRRGAAVSDELKAKAERKYEPKRHFGWVVIILLAAVVATIGAAVPYRNAGAVCSNVYGIVGPEKAVSNQDYVVQLRGCYNYVIQNVYNVHGVSADAKAAIVPHLEAIASDIIWLEPCRPDPVPPKGFKGWVPTRAERGCSP